MSRAPTLRLHAGETIVDSFAGGGGASLGIEWRFRPPKPRAGEAPDDDEEDDAQAQADHRARLAAAKSERERREAEQAEAQRKREKEQSRRLDLFKACAAKARGPLTTAEIAEIAVEAVDNLSAEEVALVYPDGAPDIRKLKPRDLGFAIRMAYAAHDLHGWSDGRDLAALAKRLKVTVPKPRKK